MRADKLKRGEENVSGPLKIYGQSFLLFRALNLKKGWLDGWRKVEKRVKEGTDGCDSIVLAGYTRMTDRLELAVREMEGIERDDDQIPALFVMTMLNYSEYPAFRLNHPRYSAYDHERTFLLIEGT